MSINSFWMVLREDSTYTSFRHSTQDRAIQEAKRLALAMPGKRFFVLACIGSAICQHPVTWEGNDPSSEIPF